MTKVKQGEVMANAKTKDIVEPKIVKMIIHGEEVDVKVYPPVGPTKKDKQVVK